MTTIWLSRNSSFTNGWRPRCRHSSSFKQPSSRSSRGASTTFSKSVSEDSSMSLSLTFTAGFINQQRLSSATRVVLRRCISFRLAKLRYLTTKTMSWLRNSLSCISLLSLTLETIKSCITSNPILFSRHLDQRPSRLMRAFSLQRSTPSCSCVSTRACWSIFVTSSHRPLRISREGQRREDSDSCNRETITHTSGRRNLPKKMHRVRTMPLSLASQTEPTMVLQP